tara:strand:- start:21711 stop:21902 length:192 start_codon:yes stop_codon:yes gene_type:complete
LVLNGEYQQQRKLITREQQGNSVQIKEAPASGLVQLFDKDEKFIGVGEIDTDGNVAPKRLLRQ